ncbi:hypothetical protein HPT25_01665 [Bacillus sp. BRMEA1]|uniref:hypothetical protein n=1 Tax=Neobacillus endophyticus TaxID=2738405 RepID=UPI001564D9FA|nr:hypothetical protein [Neobacillus endophyticus]NRD76215.1 hypothetical protein [Neobacillus endophyticus]
MGKVNRKGQVLFDSKGTYLKTLREGDIVLTKEQLEAAKRKKEEDAEAEKKKLRSTQTRGKDFVKEMISEDFKGLVSGNDSGHVLELAVRISFKKGPKNGYLIMSDINSLKAANFNDMCKIFGIHKGVELSKMGASKIIKKLESKDFLWVTREENDKYGKKRGKDTKHEGRIEETIYEINPKFFAKGRTENAQYVKFYLKHFKSLTKGLSPAEKGFLLEIAPYFHYDQYVLCKNPNETDLTKLEFFTREELAVTLEMAYSNVKAKVNVLNKAGIIGEWKTYGVMALYLHPDLVFKKDIIFEDIDYTDKIRKQFELNKQSVKDKNKRIAGQAELYNLF